MYVVTVIRWPVIYALIMLIAVSVTPAFSHGKQQSLDRCIICLIVIQTKYEPANLHFTAVNSVAQLSLSLFFSICFNKLKTAYDYGD